MLRLFVTCFYNSIFLLLPLHSLRTSPIHSFLHILAGFSSVRSVFFFLVAPPYSLFSSVCVCAQTVSFCGRAANSSRRGISLFLNARDFPVATLGCHPHLSRVCKGGGGQKNYSPDSHRLPPKKKHSNEINRGI